LKVKDFLDNFEKEHYGLTVPGRSEKRLFPKSSIKETLIIKQPSITFDTNSLSEEDDGFTFDNSYSYENLQAPWTVEILNPTIANHITAEIDDVGEYINIDCNQNTEDNNFTCQIKLTGTRTDGLGTYSATFNVVQAMKLVALKVTIQNLNSDDIFTISNNLSINTNLDYQEETIIYLLNRSTTKPKYSIYNTLFQLSSNNRDNFIVKIYNQGGDFKYEECISDAIYYYDEFRDFSSDTGEFEVAIYSTENANNLKS